MFLRWLQMVVEFFEVVGDAWLYVVLGGCRSFLLMVTTHRASLT